MGSSLKQKNIFFFSGEEYFFEIAEAVFVGWFSFEYVVRFIAAPHKSKWEAHIW